MWHFPLIQVSWMDLFYQQVLGGIICVFAAVVGVVSSLIALGVHEDDPDKLTTARIGLICFSIVILYSAFGVWFIISALVALVCLLIYATVKNIRTVFNVE